ncbi:hypothetical protein NFJ02_06g126030 [Pycnococcus provasolii]
MQMLRTARHGARRSSSVSMSVRSRNKTMRQHMSMSIRSRKTTVRQRNSRLGIQKKDTSAIHSRILALLLRWARAFDSTNASCACQDSAHGIMHPRHRRRCRRRPSGRIRIVSCLPHLHRAPTAVRRCSLSCSCAPHSSGISAMRASGRGAAQAHMR